MISARASGDGSFCRPSFRCPPRNRSALAAARASTTCARSHVGAGPLDASDRAFIAHLLRIEDPFEEDRAEVAFPESGGATVTIVFPACSGRCASRTATATAAPDEMPDRMPSSRAQSAGVGDRILVGDLLDRIDERQVEHVRHRTRAPMPWILCAVRT